MTHQQSPQPSAVQPPSPVTETRRETRATKKQLMNSFPFSAPAAVGEEPLKDLPLGGPKKRRVTALSEHERQLIAALQVWMTWPKNAMHRDRVTSLMDAHESRAYLAAVK
jgi:hypothetical protein